VKVWRNYGQAVIGTGKRSDLADSASKSKIYLLITSLEIPGPGTYRAQSDFGYYDPSDSFTAGGHRSSTALR